MRRRRDAHCGRDPGGATGTPKAARRLTPCLPPAEADELELELDYQPEEGDEQYQYGEAGGGEEEAVTEDAGGGGGEAGEAEVQGPAHPAAGGVSA